MTMHAQFFAEGAAEPRVATLRRDSLKRRRNYSAQNFWS
jgi:hypothetical protein